MATISARRRWIRDGVVRSNEWIRRMAKSSFCAGANNPSQAYSAQRKMVLSERRVETRAKIAMRASQGLPKAVVLLLWMSRPRLKSSSRKLAPAA
jgi:hypothetical protein